MNKYLESIDVAAVKKLDIKPNSVPEIQILGLVLEIMKKKKD